MAASPPGRLLALILSAFAGRFTPIVRLLTCLIQWRICPQRMIRFRAFAPDVEHLICLALTERVAVFLLAQSITWLSVVSIFIRPWLSFWFLQGVRLNIEQLCALFVRTNLVHLLPVVPGGLSWFEATMAGYISATGLACARSVPAPESHAALWSRSAPVLRASRRSQRWRR